jgi:aspartate kinase
MSDLLVAKFGGTSMAKPELVVPHLELPGEIVDIGVVSAAGEDQDHPNKVTKMLLGYKKNLFESEEIQARYQDILDQTNCNDPLSQAVVNLIPKDLAEWTARGDPVEALGEIWSAKLFAIQTGRQFVDARELIFFHNDGKLNAAATRAAIRDRLGHGGRFVVNGFCGMRADGHVQVFPRGGSDITGAILADALEVREYHNWSDVDGFMTADPKKVPGAQLLDLITYREARELGNGGSELLHRAVIPILGDTGIKTVMRNTFGALGNRGTEIVRERAWQWQPIVGVTGRDDLFYMAIHEFGLNEGVGTTVDVFEELKDAGIPYEHIADATDDVSNYLAKQYKKPVLAILDKLGHLGRTINLHDAGLVHVVGEGLARSGVNRLRILGKVATALADHGIEGRGATDVAESATLTLFINPKMVNDAIKIAHEALELERVAA